MSGILIPGFHEGNRSEYLANYLLSGLGVVNPVPRQNDIGFDFYCHLADDEDGILTFDYPFIVQVKSESKYPVSYGRVRPNKWRKQSIEWIRKLQTPLLLGFISKKRMEMEIYTTSGVRFLQIPTQQLGSPDPTIIEFRKRKKFTSDHITWPEVSTISGWPASGKGDGKKYIIDLGNPLLTINNDDIFNDKLVELKKRILKKIIRVEQNNILFRNLGVPQFSWASWIKTNEDFGVGQMFSFSEDKQVVDIMFENLSPACIAMASSLMSCGQQELALSMKPLLQRLHKKIPPWMNELFPDLV